MNALILAAGTGSRLVNLTRDLPKALVEVNNRPLIEYSLSFLKSVDCWQIVVVGGFYFDKLNKYLKPYYGLVKLVENRDFLKGNIFSLTTALPSIEDSFLLLNVDHVYPMQLAKTFRKQKEQFKNITIFVDFDRPLHEDDMKVQITPDRNVIKIAKELHEFDAGYIGITYIPIQKLDLYQKAAVALANENEDAVVESILQKLVNENQQIDIFDISGISWLEVDNSGDLQNAERILKWNINYLN